jgi:indolepyruvate ferredoxin oxidoreductase alpha subunit
MARPPVLCAGCPHRASFYAVKQAMKGKKAVFCGDIGCYTLGNAAPLDMVDTCLCMGAGITIAQGIQNAGNNSINFAFVGDSTFFASGITGIINAVYNQTDMILMVLDNSTTAMTGHQPHPGIGKTMMGEISQKVSIRKILEAIGLSFVKEVDPLDLEKSIDTVKEAAAKKGVRAIIFKSPCVAIIKNETYYTVDQNKCIGCKKCIRELGCPALSFRDGKAVIEKSLCNGCGLCNKVCPKVCMVKSDSRDIE